MSTLTPTALGALADALTDEPCTMCGNPVDSGDEPGLAQDDRGDWYAVCSEACTEAFYA